VLSSASTGIYGLALNQSQVPFYLSPLSQDKDLEAILSIN
jgi:hypothetical protein